MQLTNIPFNFLILIMNFEYKKGQNTIKFVH